MLYQYPDYDFTNYCTNMRKVRRPGVTAIINRIIAGLLSRHFIIQKSLRPSISGIISLQTVHLVEFSQHFPGSGFPEQGQLIKDNGWYSFIIFLKDLKVLIIHFGTDILVFSSLNLAMLLLRRRGTGLINDRMFIRLFPVQ